jgi:opacity protein-like surface antigen
MKKLIALASLTFISGLAMANEPGKSETGLDYNKIELNYQSFAESGVTFTGYQTNGTFLFTDNIYALGSYANYTHSGSTSIERSNLGLGYRMGIAANTDAFTSLAYSSMTQSSTNTGYALTLGVRSKIADPVDVTGSYTYTSLGSNYFNSFNVGMNYKFTDMFYATAGYTSSSGTASITQYNLGVGIKF